MIEVKERIKINGKSLSYEKFNEYFEYCYEILVNQWVKKYFILSAKVNSKFKLYNIFLIQVIK